MIFHLRLHGPDFVPPRMARDDVVHRGHGREHGVALIVVFVHAIVDARWGGKLFSLKLPRPTASQD